MTSEEAKQVLLRVIRCEETNISDCVDADCRKCQYNYAPDDRLTALKIAVQCIDLVELVIGNEDI